jgi:phosphoglycolate phosphatase
MAGRIAHVIFDLDGTLVDTGADLAASVNHVLGTFGLDPLDPATVYRYVGDGARMLVERAVGIARRDLWDSGVDIFLAFYREHLLDSTRLHDGVAYVLAALSRAGVSASVLTNKPEDLSRKILSGLGVLGAFVDVIGGDTLPVRKPDPQGVFHLLRLTDTAVGEALIVGDSPVDCATARSSDVAFCGVSWGFNPEGLAAEGVPIVGSAKDLKRVILGNDWI